MHTRCSAQDLGFGTGYFMRIARAFDERVPKEFRRVIKSTRGQELKHLGDAACHQACRKREWVFCTHDHRHDCFTS